MSAGSDVGVSDNSVVTPATSSSHLSQLESCIPILAYSSTHRITSTSSDPTSSTPLANTIQTLVVLPLEKEAFLWYQLQTRAQDE